MWYPIKLGGDAARLHSALQDSGLRKLLALELTVKPHDSPIGLNGSGVIVANPPWQLDAEMAPVHAELHQMLSHKGNGGVRIDWIVPE